MQREKTDRERLLTKAERGIRRTNAEKKREVERECTLMRTERERLHTADTEREREIAVKCTYAQKRSAATKEKRT